MLYSTPVDLNNDKVQHAITFMKDQIDGIDGIDKLNPRNFHWSLEVRKRYSSCEKIPWILYGFANHKTEVEENIAIYNNYKDSTPNDLSFYLPYHNCTDAVIFYWSHVVSSKIGTKENTKIAYQNIPQHAYIMIDDTIFDPLYHYCNVKFNYDISETTLYSSPYDFYSDLFISKSQMAEWEKDVLVLLKKIEMSV